MRPLLVYCMPGGASVRCEFSKMESSGALCFGDARVMPWCTSVQSVGESANGGMSVCPASTSRQSYLDRVDRLIDILRHEGGKAVVARRLCGRFGEFDPETLRKEYFAMFPDMFRFFFYHPATGYWMGATPELLLKTEGSKTAYTRALAGTRPNVSTNAWDNKNIEEHRFVVDDMVRRIERVSPTLSVDTLSPCNLRYGSIEHLCTPLAIHNSVGRHFPASEVIAAIHPTAAVGGYPRERALELVALNEDYPRYCYGGTITIGEGDATVAYVMLRCVHFDSEKWAIYSGSGITPASDSRDEWDETQAKATPLLNLLSR